MWFWRYPVGQTDTQTNNRRYKYFVPAPAGEANISPLVTVKLKSLGPIFQCIVARIGHSTYWYLSLVRQEVAVDIWFQADRNRMAYL